jgi:transposase InsO family protein
MDEWAYGRGVRLQFIEPGKPIQNAFIESFNTRLRYRLGHRRGIRGGTQVSLRSLVP